MSFFPEIFSNSPEKYSRIAIWLITQEGVVCPNVRDMFTAGGKVDLIFGKEVFRRVPKVFKTLTDNLPSVIETIMQSTPAELSSHWQLKTSQKSKLTDWIDIFSIEAAKIHDAKHINFKDMIRVALNR